jgi:anti-sigma B factor antagonist
MIRLHMDAPARLTLDIGGPATMLEGATVEQTATEHFAHGTRVLSVDLRDCTMMDSTFSGTLLSLRRQLEKVGGELILVSPSAAVLEVLRLMGLETFYAIDVAERASGPWQPVTPVRREAEELKRLVLESHELLAEVPGPARHEFRSVVEELRRNQEPKSINGPTSINGTT